MSDHSYSRRFQHETAVEHYEFVEYAPTSYSSHIWQLQMPVLTDIMRRYKSQTEPSRLLDFACGTGRILSFLADQVNTVEGVDISASMAQVAKQKCPDAYIHVGDILADPSLATADYHIITMFRFLLNTEPAMRIRVLRELRKRLVAKNGILIANVHGNSASARSVAVWYRQSIRGESHAMMSRVEIKRMFQESGFDVIEEFGFGVVPPSLFRTRLKGLAKWLDKRAVRTEILTPVSIDLLYVCRPH